MLQILFPGYLLKELATSFVDNVFRDRVSEPAIGSVVYCDYVFGLAEHSGIYLGDEQIMHLNGKGRIERVSPEKFMEGKTGVSIYVGCIGSRPVGSKLIAERALHLEKTEGSREYNVLLENCHQFSESCITGKQSSATFLTFLKDACKQNMGVDSWLVWDREAQPQRGADNTVSAVNVALLDEKIKKQNQVCTEHRALVNGKLREYSEHSDKNPAFSTFGGLFYESKAKAWDEKFNRLGTELRNLERIMDEMDNQWGQLVRQQREMEGKLGEQ